MICKHEWLYARQEFVFGNSETIKHEIVFCKCGKVKDNEYFRSEVMRIAREMLDTTHGLTTNQKDRYAEYLISLAYTDKPEATK